MGEWPTIFDKSTTLTLGDGRRFFVGSPLGLGSIGLKIANYQTKSMIDALCCAVEGRQEKNIMKVSQLLRLLGGAGASTLNNQIMPRRIGEHIQTGKLIALPLPPLTLLPLAGSLGMARSLAPTMINLPSLDDIDIDNPDVTKMDETQRMLWVLVKCGEILSQTGKSEVAEAFKQLLDPKIIGLIVAGLIVWGASHFVGVGFIFDIAMVVVIGVAVLKAFETMWDIYKIITKASTKTELTKAAKMMADMVIDIGVETFLAIVLKGAAKSRFRAPPSKATGSADEAVEFAPARTRGKSSDQADSKKNKKKPPKSREDIIDNEIKTNPKFADTIQKEPDAVYGYSAKPGGGLDKFGIDYSDPKQVASARAKRKPYLDNLEKKRVALQKEIQDVKDSGGSVEELAKKKVAQRNRDRIDSYLKDNNQEGLERMYKRNKQKYGQKEGPTFEQLSKDKTAEEVILSSTRTSDAFSATLGLWP